MDKKQFTKENLKDKLISAFIIAPTLAVVLISAAYQLLASQNAGMLKSPLALSMSIVTLVAISAGMILSIVYGKELVPIIYALIFGLGFICYLSFTLNGTTDIADDAFFEMMMLIFSLPLMSFMSVPTFIGGDRAVVLIVLSGLITAVSVAVAIVIAFNKKRELKEYGKKAKAEMPDSSRRKIR